MGPRPWPIAFSADGPTGACQLAASLGGMAVSQPLNEPQSQTTWHQCPAGSFSQSVQHGSDRARPSVPLVMWARDAAYDYGAGRYLSDRHQVRQHRQRPCRRRPVGSDRCPFHGWDPVCDSNCFSRSFRGVWHRLFDGRRFVPVVSEVDRPDPSRRSRDSPGHVLWRQQRTRCLGPCGDIRASVTRLEHSRSDGGGDRVRKARRCEAVPART